MSKGHLFIGWHKGAKSIWREVYEEWFRHFQNGRRYYRYWKILSATLNKKRREKHCLYARSCEGKTLNHYLFAIRDHRRYVTVQFSALTKLLLTDQKTLGLQLHKTFWIVWKTMKIFWKFCIGHWVSILKFWPKSDADSQLNVSMVNTTINHKLLTFRGLL